METWYNDDAAINWDFYLQNSKLVLSIKYVDILYKINKASKISKNRGFISIMNIFLPKTVIILKYYLNFKFLFTQFIIIFWTNFQQQKFKYIRNTNRIEKLLLYLTLSSPLWIWKNHGFENFLTKTLYKNYAFKLTVN